MTPSKTGSGKSTTFRSVVNAYIGQGRATSLADLKVIAASAPALEGVNAVPGVAAVPDNDEVPVEDDVEAPPAVSQNCNFARPTRRR